MFELWFGAEGNWQNITPVKYAHICYGSYESGSSSDDGLRTVDVTVKRGGTEHKFERCDWVPHVVLVRIKAAKSQ